MEGPHKMMQRDIGWWAALRRRIRTLFGIVPALDLHGLGVQDAQAETERFLRAAQAAGEPVVRIVYGKGRRSPGGRGVLREVIPHWLENEGKNLVHGFERLPDHTGGDGSVRVWVRVGEESRKASVDCT
jgi:DNA-nicking Smr family endonuclease